jgi:hypothetical protein
MSRIVLLSCTKSKLDKKSPAYQLYSPSPMFQKTLEYGKSLKPDKMFIFICQVPSCTYEQGVGTI